MLLRNRIVVYFARFMKRHGGEPMTPCGGEVNLSQRLAQHLIVEPRRETAGTLTAAHKPERARWRQLSRTILLVTVVLTATSCTSPAIAGSKSEPQQKEIYGYLEDVVLSGVGIELPAKLDTGADTSSLDATQIKRFRRSDVSWVRFTIEDPENGELVTLERHYVRSARIKRHDGEHQRRPVVEVDVCLGGESYAVEVSLIDRSQFDYPILLGRSALEGVALVDSELTFTTSPDCDLEEKLSKEDD